MQLLPQRPASFLAHLQALPGAQWPGLRLDAVQPGDAPDRLPGHFACIGLGQFVQLASRVRQAVGGAAPLQRERGFIAAVGVHHQRAHPALTEGVRILASAPGAEVIHHPGHILEGTSRVGPHVGSPGLAPTRVKKCDRCLVGMHHRAGEHEGTMGLCTGAATARRCDRSRPPAWSAACAHADLALICSCR